MPGLPIFDKIREEFEHGVQAAEQRIEHPFRRDAAPQAPAIMPAIMAAAPAPARPKENTVSLQTLENDLAAGLGAVKSEIGRFESNLPAMVAEAKAIGGSPLGQLAVTAAQHVAAGILPPEALAIVESGAAKLYTDILGLYAPQGAQQAPTGQQPVQAPAQ